MATAEEAKPSTPPKVPGAVAPAPEPVDIAKESKPEDEEKKEDVPTVGYWAMYRYATARQWTLTIVGCIMSWLNGASLPAFALLFGGFRR